MAYITVPDAKDYIGGISGSGDDALGPAERLDGAMSRPVLLLLDAKNHGTGKEGHHQVAGGRYNVGHGCDRGRGAVAARGSCQGIKLVDGTGRDIAAFNQKSPKNISWCCYTI